MTENDLREKYAEVIHAANCRKDCHIGVVLAHQRAADAVLAVRDDVLAETEWMRDHWERCFNEANGAAADALRAMRNAEARERRLREALAKVEGVDFRALAETLAKDATTLPEWFDGGWRRQAARINRVEDRLRAALASVPAVDAGDREPASEGRCTGAGDCEVAVHVHGCYADTGACDDPGDHHREPASEVQP